MSNSNSVLSISRVLVVFIILLLFWIIVVGRLFQIQIIQHKEYISKAKEQQSIKRIVSARRGTIRDRNGVPLSVNVPAFTFYAIRDSIKNKSDVAIKFGNLQNISPDKIKNRLLNNPLIVIANKIYLKEEYSKIMSWKIPGIFAKTDSRRLSF